MFSFLSKKILIYFSLAIVVIIIVVVSLNNNNGKEVATVVRADVVQETGRQVLKINSDYPLYQAAKRIGDDALELYVNESAALKICEMVTKGKSIEDYVELVNQVLARCGEVYRGRIRESRAVRSRNK